MARVGQRVRKARKRMGIARRRLSEISGVSPRYLAQIEAGEGNMSIALLQRVALALECRIDWLISPDDAGSGDDPHIAELFRAAPAEVQRQILGTLSAHSAGAARAGRICLIGLRGAGKSTLGKLAGAALRVPFLELNREIEAQSGMAVEEVIALYGPEGYRKLEAQAVEHVIATHDRVILAVAGGIVENGDTYGALLSRCHTIWVRTSPDEHMARVRAQGDERPMAGNPEAMEQLKTILRARDEQYSRADAQLQTSGQTVERSLTGLLRIVRERRFLG
jgi:XRE family aerobic/anaerobic benzoate catabolism transcriptional regulator